MRIVSGAFRGRSIRSVSGADDQARGYRPAMAKVRQAVFSMLEARGLEWAGLRVLDLFAGTGSLGLEALSRGAARVLFVENDRRAGAAIGRTLDDFGLGRDRALVVVRDLFLVLASACPEPYGLVFVDPPYGRAMAAPALAAALEGGWIAPGALVAAEIEAAADLDPDGVHPLLELETDRCYGQTRILLWRKRQPSTPAPSTP